MLNCSMASSGWPTLLDQPCTAARQHLKCSKWQAAGRRVDRRNGVLVWVLWTLCCSLWLLLAVYVVSCKCAFIGTSPKYALWLSLLKYLCEVKEWDITPKEVSLPYQGCTIIYTYKLAMYNDNLIYLASSEHWQNRLRTNDSYRSSTEDILMLEIKQFTNLKWKWACKHMSSQ